MEARRRILGVVGTGDCGKCSLESSALLTISVMAASLKVINLHPSRTSHIMISVSTQLFLVLFSLLLVLPVVEAVEAGDAIALLLGVILSITGICACLGVYARKRNGQM
ncbi:hypothetical protein Celaphus_00012036 [Cervus elaphus hippelaphus]|nr:hypothetical protein Celaphus_00012036 [Cervus elaphus hippelaphus]